MLVDRVWPRGLTESQVGADGWLKEAAPSAALRTWFGHDPAKWTELRSRYLAELDAAPAAVAELLAAVGRGRVTLLHAARDGRHTQAVALAEYLRSRAGAPAALPPRDRRAPIDPT